MFALTTRRGRRNKHQALTELPQTACCRVIVDQQDVRLAIVDNTTRRACCQAHCPIWSQRPAVFPNRLRVKRKRSPRRGCETSRAASSGPCPSGLPDGSHV